MATRTIETEEKSVVTRAILGSEYATSTTAQRAQMDEFSRVALNRVNQIAQYLTYGAQTTDADSLATLDEGTFFDWWVADASYRMAQSYKREMVDHYVRARRDAFRDAVLGFTSAAPNSGTGQGTTYSVVDLRRHILAHMVRRETPIYPDVLTVDQSIMEAVNEVWNYGGWPWRRRRVKMRIRRYEFEAAWTNATLTLTDVGAFASFTMRAGASVFITAGDDATKGEYLIATKTSDDAITLVGSISDDGDDLTGVVGSFYVVEMIGLATGEAFDSPASRGFTYDITDRDAYRGAESMLYDLAHVGGSQIRFLSADQMASMRSSGTEGMPQAFRLQSWAGDRVWQFHPWPDADYSLHGEVFLKVPAFPADATLTTMVDAFPTEFRPIVRDLSLKKALSKHGQRADYDMEMARVQELWHLYDNHGNADADQTIRDVNGDWDRMWAGGLGVYGMGSQGNHAP